MPRPPSVLAGGRWIAPHEHLDSSTSDLRPPRITHHSSPQGEQPARRADCSPCGHSLVTPPRDRSSSILKIWPTPATTSAAPSLDPGSAATQLPENGLRGSFYFTSGVRPSYMVRNIHHLSHVCQTGDRLKTKSKFSSSIAERENKNEPGTRYPHGTVHRMRNIKSQCVTPGDG